MLLFKLVKCTNSLIKKAFGKFYARPVVTHTIGIAELAEHMASHNTPFSAGTIRGILTDMVVCVRELVMQNVAVKIENLAIFSIGIRPKKGADSEEEFSVANHIDGVRLRARATGKFSNNQLDLEATLKNVKELTKKKGKTSDTGSDTGSDTVQILEIKGQARIPEIKGQARTLIPVRWASRERRELKEENRAK